MTGDILPLHFLSSSVFVGTETEGWTLDEFVAEYSEGRSFVVPIEFSTPFSSAPVVHLGLTGFDLAQETSARLRLNASDITPYGFSAILSTWRSTRVYSAEFQWFAAGS